MRESTNTPLILAFAIVVVLFLCCSSGAMPGGMMNVEMSGGGWIGAHSWMGPPALLALGIGIVLGWLIFKKKE